jgi:serine/threonine protein kinase
MPKSKSLEFRSAFGVYRSVRRIGEGGAGSVYEATDDGGGRVAVKLLDPAKASKEKLKRFRNEILFGSTPRHDNIVRVLDHGLIAVDDTETLFYVMPFYQVTLRDLLRSGVAPTEALRLYATLLDGVEAAHLLGVVHRDLKPENVLYDGARKALVVADFGIARFEQEELYTLVETRPGTRLANFLYAAPEQKVRGQPVDKRADVYALGLMLNELFTGEVPQGTGYKQVAGVRPEFVYLDAVVDAMIRNNPSERPADIDGVKQRLIGERNDFISRQKLDALSKTVVPEGTVDDPLVRDPIRAVDVDVDNAGVSLRLNRQPNQRWVELYRNMSGVSFFLGLDFRRFPIAGGRISIRAPSDHQYQQMIAQVKTGIEATNRAYAVHAQAEAEERVAEQRRRLQEAAEAEKRRLELRDRLRL